MQQRYKIGTAKSVAQAARIDSSRRNSGRTNNNNGLVEFAYHAIAIALSARMVNTVVVDTAQDIVSLVHHHSSS
jgi:hypothetical protein